MEGEHMAETQMQRSNATKLEGPRLQNGRALLIAGLRSHFSHDAIGQIPVLWQRFVPYTPRIFKRVGQLAYGVCCNSSDTGMDYLAGIEVSACEGLPAEFAVMSLPAQRYAVFAHRGHVSKINETCAAIFQWFEEHSNQRLAAAGDDCFFERYGEDFNPHTGMGGMEVWVPVKS
jgi:AraC family transcriptional regulator